MPSKKSEEAGVKVSLLSASAGFLLSPNYTASRFTCESDYLGRCEGGGKTIFFLNSHNGGWSPNWVHSAHRPLNGLLYLPRVIMMMENLVERRLAGETEVLGENLP
jgi:hypothetical protein